MTDTPDRESIAREYGVPGGLADMLNGATEVELRESAEKLVQAIGRPRPAPDHSQGAEQPDPGYGQLSRADLARMTPQQITAAQERGQFSDLMAGRQG